MRVFIAGATGVLGHRMVQQFKQKNHDVMGLVRDEQGRQTIQRLGGEGVFGSIFDADSMARAVKTADVVIHAATAIPTKVSTTPADWEFNQIMNSGTRGRLVYLSVLVAALSACAQTNPARTPAVTTPVASTQLEKAAVNPIPVIHVFVALADNVNQGIVPVSASLGNGDNPATNLYWGAAFGIRTFFSRSRDWELISVTRDPSEGILERCIFKHRRNSLLLVADAYQGKQIKQTTSDFLEAAAGKPGEKLKARDVEFQTGGSADLVAYIGHNGLMDFTLETHPTHRDDRQRRAIILACASKQYFSSALQQSGATPLLWTTNLMAPEAYVLSAAIDGWLKKESDEQIRLRAADAYNKYQNCGIRGARALFATGW